MTHTNDQERAQVVPETIEQRAKKLKGLQVLIGATAGVPEAIELARSRFIEAYGRSPLHDDLAYACLLIDAYGGAPAAPVLKGWKLVPKEATPEMLEQVWHLGYDEMRDAYRALVAAAPQPPESNSAEFDRIKAAPVPKFNHAAKRKLELLQGDGATITGYAIEKDGRRGAIDCHGFVYWWNEAEPVQMPEPRWYSPSPGDAAHFPYYTPEDVSHILALHGIK